MADEIKGLCMKQTFRSGGMSIAFNSMDVSGRNIWSLAVNQTEDLIATGGGDGSIRLWLLSSPDLDSRGTVREACLPSSNNSTHNKAASQKAKREDYPRFVCLLDHSNLLVMTNEGYVTCTFYQF